MRLMDKINAWLNGASERKEEKNSQQVREDAAKVIRLRQVKINDALYPCITIHGIIAVVGNQQQDMTAELFSLREKYVDLMKNTPSIKIL